MTQETSLRRADWAVAHLYDLVLTPTRIKVTQFAMLRSIADAGEIAHCDLTRQSVGSEEAFSRRSASARRRGWVSMRIGDRQRRLYQLSEGEFEVLTKPFHPEELIEKLGKQTIAESRREMAAA